MKGHTAKLEIKLECLCYCRLAVGGPVVPAIKLPAVHPLAAMPAGEAVTWRLSFRIISFGRITLQAFLLLPAKVAVLPGQAPSEVHGKHFALAALKHRQAIQCWRLASQWHLLSDGCCTVCHCFKLDLSINRMLDLGSLVILPTAIIEILLQRWVGQH